MSCADRNIQDAY